MKFAQSILQNGTDVLKAHAEGTRDLVQTLSEQSWKQQEAFQTLASGSFNTYVDFLTAPFSYYQETLDAATSAARRGVMTESATDLREEIISLCLGPVSACETSRRR